MWRTLDQKPSASIILLYSVAKWCVLCMFQPTILHTMQFNNVPLTLFNTVLCDLVSVYEITAHYDKTKVCV